MFLAIVWGDVAVQVGQLLLALSILVILHEFGHYITARWFGCRVEKFFLFFDPWFALFKKKIGETTYGIGWLPLGGYVKISGMIDESMDKDQLKLPPQKWEFRSKPAWQRLIIMLGGVIMNVLTAFVIYVFIVMIWGEKTVPMNSLKYGVSVEDSVMYNIGLRDGDQVLAVNGEPVNDMQKLTLKIALGETVTVSRDGKTQELKVPQQMLGQLAERKRNRSPLLGVRVENVIIDLLPDSTGAKAGLKKGDQIVMADSTPVRFYDQLKPYINQHAGDTIVLGILRGNQPLTLSVPVSKAGFIGLAPARDFQTMDSLGYCKLVVTKYNLGGAIPAAIRIAGDQMSGYVAQLKKVFNPKTEGYKAMGGFRGIGRMFSTTWDWESFWQLTALLSIVLAIMNLLPIPALDGGHVLFTLIEMITGKKPNEKFLEYAQIVGMVLLLGLMLYANGNDWFGWGAR